MEPKVKDHPFEYTSPTGPQAKAEEEASESKGGYVQELRIEEDESNLNNSNQKDFRGTMSSFRVHEASEQSPDPFAVRREVPEEIKEEAKEETKLEHKK